MSAFIKKTINMVDADVSYYTTNDPEIFPDRLFTYLHNETPWTQRTIYIYGKHVPEPRMTCWYGDFGYQYSGVSQSARPMTEMISNLRDEVSDLAGVAFNGVLLNLYLDGQHSVGYHSDDEPELGENPTIASLSLGAERRFVFKHKTKDIPDVKLDLVHGDILVMRG